MAKKKISFDIDTSYFSKLKQIIELTNISQGEFLRKATYEAISKFDNEVYTVYTIENESLIRKTIDKKNYIIEIDDSDIDKDLLEDFQFITSGFFIKNGVRKKFYSKIYLQ